MKQVFLIILLCTAIGASSCKKFLDAKPDKKLVIPSSIADLQALLDDNYRMNGSCSNLGEIAADNYYLPFSTWQSFDTWDRNAYIWLPEMYTAVPNDWSITYDMIYYANVVLENIEKVPHGIQELDALNNAKGSALLFRAKSFLEAAFTWCKAYDSSTAMTDLGLPLRLSSDFNQPSVRSSLQNTYDQIVGDLLESIKILPVKPVNVMRPSKPAAYGLLARVYLSMGEFYKSLLYSDSCLQLFNTLLDYNTLDSNSGYPISRFKEEDIMHSRMPNLHLNLANSYALVDTVLYKSYAENDLRKTIFFRSNGDGTFRFKGSYDGTSNLFNGVASDEMYLIRAECLARAGKLPEALTDLNTLLKNRLMSGTFIPVSADSREETIELILNERRKELIFRNLRWMDLKRLNKEGANITVTRILDNVKHVLTPNDNRYALPLPPDVINLSGMQQNPGN